MQTLLLILQIDLLAELLRSFFKYFACVGNTEALSNLLTKNNIDINKQDDSGRSILMEAASKGRLKSVELLLQHGAHIDACGQNGIAHSMLFKTGM